MPQLGKNIELFLMDGTPTKRWQVTLSNWNCHAFKIPRTELKRCDNDPDMADIHKPGVYFLFGREDETNRRFVYVGEGEDALKRILQPHPFDNGDSYWSEVVILVTPDGTLDKAKINI